MSSFTCCLCDSPLPSQKTGLLCQICFPGNNQKLFCLHCIRLHVRKHHKVTDLEGQPIEICEQHASVESFLCRSCGFSTFCMDCQKQHNGHDYFDMNEPEGKDVVEMKRKSHVSLSKLDVMNKCCSAYLGQTKTMLERFDEVVEECSPISVQRQLEQIARSAIQSSMVKFEKVDLNNTEQRLIITLTIEELEKVLGEYSDSQLYLRNVLGSTPRRIAKEYQMNKVDEIEKKLESEQCIFLPVIDENRADTFLQNIRQEGKKMGKEFQKLISKYFELFVFDGIFKTKTLRVDTEKIGCFEIKSLQLAVSSDKLITVYESRKGSKISVFVFQYTSLDQKPVLVHSRENCQNFRISSGNFACARFHEETCEVFQIFRDSPTVINRNNSVERKIMGLNKIKAKPLQKLLPRPWTVIKRAGEDEVFCFDFPSKAFQLRSLNGNLMHSFDFEIDWVSPTSSLAVYSPDSVSLDCFVFAVETRTGIRVFYVRYGNPSETVNIDFDKIHREKCNEYKLLIAGWINSPHDDGEKALLCVWCRTCKMLSLIRVPVRVDDSHIPVAANQFEVSGRTTLPDIEVQTVVTFGTSCIMKTADCYLYFIKNIFDQVHQQLDIQQSFAANPGTKCERTSQKLLTIN